MSDCDVSQAENVDTTDEGYANYLLSEKDKEIQSLQARIDELMLEYCPNDMTKEQIENWEKHQVKSEIEI